MLLHFVLHVLSFIFKKTRLLWYCTHRVLQLWFKSCGIWRRDEEVIWGGSQHVGVGIRVQVCMSRGWRRVVGTLWLAGCVFVLLWLKWGSDQLMSCYMIFVHFIYLFHCHASKIWFLIGLDRGPGAFTLSTPNFWGPFTY